MTNLTPKEPDAEIVKQPRRPLTDEDYAAVDSALNAALPDELLDDEGTDDLKT